MHQVVVFIGINHVSFVLLVLSKFELFSLKTFINQKCECDKVSEFGYLFDLCAHFH